jgi:hypothetical protein
MLHVLSTSWADCSDRVHTAKCPCSCCAQASAGLEQADRVLTLLHVQQALGLAASPPLAPAALAEAALQVLLCPLPTLTLLLISAC